MHTASKRTTHCKQKRNGKKICTLQSNELHAANEKGTVKKFAHCKQKNYTLQTKLPHTANKSKSTACADVLWSRNVDSQQPERSKMFIFSSLSLSHR